MKNTLLLFALITSTSFSLPAQEKVKAPTPEIEYTQEEPVVKTLEDQEEPICSIPEVDANYPGGMAAMNQYLTENLKYPQFCLDNEISGKVILQFVIEKDGSLTHIEIKKEIHPLLDKEAVRLIQNMPKWTPAMNKGEVVRSRTYFPISFSLH